MSAPHVTPADLRAAADWCETYQDGDPKTAAAIRRVGIWLAAEAVRREREAAVRGVMRQHGVTRRFATGVVERCGLGVGEVA